jgi:HEAT repeat protein
MHTRQTSAALLVLALTLPLHAQARLEATTEPARPNASYPSELEGRSLSQWVQDLKHPDPCIRERALAALPLFGPAASNPEVIGLVIERTTDRDASPKVRAVLVLNLLDIKPTEVHRVVNALTLRLDDSQSQVRYAAAVGLQRFGEESRPAVEKLASWARDPTAWEIRRACLLALTHAGRNCKAGGSDPRAVRAMINARNDATVEVRLAAAMGLGMLGKPTSDTRLGGSVDEALRFLVKDHDKRVVIWTHLSQMAVDNKVNDTTVLAIAHLLSASDAPVRLHATRALAALGPKGKIALDSLLDAIQDKDDEVAISAIDAVVQMDERSARVYTALNDLSQSKVANPGPVAAAKHALDVLKKGKKK